MRIGLVVEEFDPRRGGVEHWTYQFAHRVLSGGHEVHVVAGRFASGVEQLGIVAHRVEPGRSKLHFAAAAERALARLKLDVVHDTGCGWACDVLQPHGGSRVASFEQNLLLLPEWLRPLKRRVGVWLPRYREFATLTARQYAADGRLFLAISQMVARDLTRYHGVPAERLRLVYNGVDLERFSPERRAQDREPLRAALGVGPDELLLLLVAHNFRLKGVPTALDAVARLGREGRPVRLAIAGGRRLAPWQRAAERLGVGRAVTFLGSVDDASPYYAAADVYVQPTYYDPCSLVVLEALASGLPVITSRFNGAGELLTEGVEGHVMHDPGDAEELAHLVRPLGDAGLRSRMGDAARRLATTRSLARNADEILAVYAEVAQSGRRRRAA